MYFLFVAKIYLLTLLKISYGLTRGLLLITVLMAIISTVVGDKYFFIKKINKLRRYIYGEL